MGFLSFPHPKGDTNLTWEAFSQISVLFSELLSHTESQLRTDPSEAEGAATQQDSFSLCVCVCKPHQFHDLVYQLVGTEEGKGSLFSWRKSPKPCGEWGGTGTIT